MDRAKLVLPLPLSPTTPSVSPNLIFKKTLSKAQKSLDEALNKLLGPL